MLHFFFQLILFYPIDTKDILDIHKYLIKKTLFKKMFRLIQINGGITLNVDLSVKSVIYVNKIMFGILLHVVVKMENI